MSVVAGKLNLVSKRLFTSESVTEGHPDKVADQVSDALLDAFLTKDPQSRVAVETVLTTGLVHVVGEVSTQSYVEIPELVREVISGIGYTSSDVGFDGNSCGITVSIDQQSPDIAGGVNSSLEIREGAPVGQLSAQGAGDQGMMFGYATDETPEFLPTSLAISHQLARRLAQVRHEGILDYLRPDGKTQVTVAFDGDKPVGVDAVVLSTQHAPHVSQTQIQAEVMEAVIQPVLQEYSEKLQLETASLKTYVNPSGVFVIGGPQGDAGLTGRKIIVDTYGGAARHGGGAFSGKDPSKVDRSAAYAVRWVAKNVVAAGLASRCEVQVSYAIGRAEPVSIYVETFGTHTVAPEKIEKAIREVFDLRPLAIIRSLDLLRPIYQPTAAYGHFGRNELGFTWEELNRVEALKAAVE